MICLRSQLSLKKDTTAAEAWDAISKWRINSKNTPKKLRAWLSENPYEKLPGIPIDEKIGKVSISVYAVSKKSFAFKLLEDNDEFITTICFDSELSKYNFSLEMEIKEQYANKFSRPKIFNFISYLQINTQKLHIKKVIIILLQILLQIISPICLSFILVQIRIISI